MKVSNLKRLPKSEYFFGISTIKSDLNIQRKKYINHVVLLEYSETVVANWINVQECGY
jgi:hypothetical protein